MDRVHLYYPELVSLEQYLAWLIDPSIPIVSTEGEWKSACLFRIALERMVEDKPAFIVIGLQGVNCYRGKIGKVEGPNGESIPQKDILEDFIKIPLKGRKFTILFDADIHTNQNVKRAAKDYAREMYQLDAQAHIAEIPLDLGLKACDDIAYALGDDKVLEIIENARPYTLTQPKKESYEEKGRRGVVLREAVRKAETSNQGEAIAQQTLGAKMCKRLASLWAQAGRLKPEDRDLLFTLHAMGEGEAEIDFYYKDLYSLLYQSDGSEIKDGKLSSSASQKIRRRFKKLAETENQCGIQFVELTPGSRDEDGGGLPSHIQLFSYDYIQEMEDLAATDPKAGRNKQSAFERAIKLFVQHKTGEPIKRKPEKQRNVFVEIKDGWQRVKGNLRSNVERMREEGYFDESIAEDLIKVIPEDLLPVLQAQLSLQNEEISASGRVSKLTPRRPLESMVCDPFFEKKCTF